MTEVEQLKMDIADLENTLQDERDLSNQRFIENERLKSENERLRKALDQVNEPLDTVIRDKDDQLAELRAINARTMQKLSRLTDAILDIEQQLAAAEIERWLFDDLRDEVIRIRGYVRQVIISECKREVDDEIRRRTNG